MRRVVLTLLTVVFLALTPVAASSAGGPQAQAAGSSVPTLAYYYQWFTTSSWARAKVDYPMAGRYSSDDVSVMRRQVAQAKAAGIDGFIVSWKDSPVNNRRLEDLVTVARAAHFKLAVIYQGLNFSRDPLPVARVAADMAFFQREYAHDPVFDIFAKPLLIWSGTWRFSAADVEQVTRPLRASLLVLATEKSPGGYERVARSFDGDAYYWSSVNPQRNAGYQARLNAMSATVHRSGGLWLAPFAPGFDARLVGGTQEVLRRGGDTLRREYAAALASSPDALGLISWNEFSEITHVEPSQTYGDTYLTVLSRLLTSGGVTVSPLAADSSEAGAFQGRLTGVLGVGAFLLLVGGITVVGLARRRPKHPGQKRVRAVAPGHPDGGAGERRPGRWTGGAVVVVMVLVLVGVVADRRTQAATDPTAPTPLYLGAQPVRSGDRVVVGAAGDIACPADKARLEEERTRPDSCRMDLTAALMTSLHPDAVLALGDNQYPSGAAQDFRTSYDRTWGAFKGITFPVPGNHEYGTPGAAGYFSYFGDRAGQPGKGYYSYDLGQWHVVALNSECAHIGGCAADSPQATWLRQDLTAHPRACTLAYWHRPRFSSGTHGNNVDNDPLWRLLAVNHADVVLGGHDHGYERFDPLDADGRPDVASGVTEFVVGTGGDSHYKFHLPDDGSALRLAGSYGVLRLELAKDGFSWQFLRAPGGTAADSGSTRCH